MSPYSNPALNQIYQLLFCDNPGLFGDAAMMPAHPAPIAMTDLTEAELEAIVTDQHTEPRIRLLASRILISRGRAVSTRQLLGVITEVGMEEGLDTLAVYADCTARYLHYSERLIIWDAPDPQVRALTQEIMQQSIEIVQRIGPWDGSRKDPPAAGMLRLSFLMTDGLYFGEGPMQALFGDPMAGPVLQSMTKLMQFLVEHEIETRGVRTE